jgi:CheY-like chemotaxis protein
MAQVQKHALIVDDDFFSRDILVRLLIQNHVVCTGAESGKAAFEILEHTLPDIIFLDLDLPDMTGFQVRQTLLLTPRFQHIPVIAYSVMTDAIMQAKEEQFNGFLSKPLNASGFSLLLTKILTGEAVWDRGV